MCHFEKIHHSQPFHVCFVTRGGVIKDPAPVTSLRDLMQEEEQRQSGKKPEMVELLTASTAKSPTAQGKAGSSRKKLK